MSARVCFMRRSDRGAAMRSLRLVDLASDHTWPAEGQSPGSAESIAQAAGWVHATLDASRSDSSIAMLCLDVDGGVCTWIASPSADPSVVASAARIGGENGKLAGGVFEFYSPGELDSTIQPLAEPTDTAPGRLPVMAISDVPARLLIDALDRERTPVESVASLWHAMALAWDPGARTTDDPGLSASGPATGIILIDPAGRLVWCWARTGSLLLAGSIRLRLARGEQGDTAEYGPDEVARLTTEWLAWSVQVGVCPGRIVCVLSSSESDRAFGEALAKAWPNTPIDAVRDQDPIGSTLRRTAERLEATPKSRVRAPGATTGLVGLSSRPGLVHRRMHVWRGVALIALASVMGLCAWRLYAAAGEAGAAAKSWGARTEQVIKDSYPDALIPRSGVSALKVMDDEILSRRRNLRPPERTDQTMPILEELETITMVIGSGRFSLESIELKSMGTKPTITVLTQSTPDAEALEEALNRISNSHIATWTGRYSSRQDGGTQRIQATYQGDWAVPTAPKPGGAP